MRPKEIIFLRSISFTRFRSFTIYIKCDIPQIGAGILDFFLRIGIIVALKVISPYGVTL